MYRIRLLVFASIALGACEASIPEVVRFEDVPVGELCRFGGVVIETGPDLNGNGRLDDEEVDYVDVDCFRHSVRGA